MAEPQKEQPRREHEVDKAKKAARNMHEGVEADEDRPCICSPEPRWQALAEEMEREKQARGDKPA